MEVLNHYLSQASANLAGTSFKGKLKESIEKNLELFKASEVPHRRIEDWKYTNLKSLLSKNYLMENKTDYSFTPSTDENFTHLYFVNGVFQKDISQETKFEIIPLKDANEDELAAILADESNYFQNDFAKLFNQSSLNAGHVFKLKEKTMIEKPIFIHNYYSGENSHHNINNFFLVDTYAHVKVFEEIKSDANVLLNYSSHASVSKFGILGHIILQDTDTTALCFQNINSTILGHGSYRNVVINTGAKTSRTNLYLNMAEEQANCEGHGLYALSDNQHHDTMSFIHHSAPHTESHQLYKGILNNESRGVFTGRVRVEQDAQLINANQLNKNLLLTKKAHANSRPQMEIYADDVKCAHGSTTGQLSEQELFYFESRGIKEDKARKMLARAFAYDVVLKISDLKIREYIQNHLINKQIVS